MRAASSPTITARAIEPELLDLLPASHPLAVGSRRDLVWVNALMRQPFIMRGLLARHAAKPPRRILDIGAGDGRFMLAVARRMVRRWPEVELVLLDRTPLPAQAVRAEFEELGWHAETVTAEMFEWLERARCERFDIVCANLVLHHFDDEHLAQLFRLVAPMTRLFAATEPRRARVPLFATRLLPAIGANRVTLHDAAASVRAGFSGAELSQLWPEGAGRAIEERRVHPFTHAFAATGSAP
jgi:2-polyprenyl-3-methyl-5-hydroxy-6-metoxy-1,4-benzoquinol methylase